MRAILASKMPVQLHVGEMVTEAGFLPITHPDDHFPFRKPMGGFWTSSWDVEERTSGWVEWGRSENYGRVDDQDWWLYQPVGDQPLILIHTLNDAEDMYRRFRIGDPRWPGLDFMAMWEEGYVGVHLTDDGQWATRHTMHASLYGWDCESVVWFEWAFAGDPVRVSATVPV